MEEINRARLDAMAKKCKQHGGDCSCIRGRCQALETIQPRIVELKRELEQLQSLEKYLKTPPVPAREGWRMPQPPQEGYRLCVYFDGNEACLHWTNDAQDWIDARPTDWPFGGEFAYASDFRRLGIEIVD